MSKMPIDPARVMFVACGPATPVVKNRLTGELATDRESGRTMHQLHLTAFVVGEAKPEVWTVKVAGEPAAFTMGEQVQVVGLIASDWENGDRHGVSFRAEAIESATAAKRPPVSGADVPPPPPARAKAA